MKNLILPFVVVALFAVGSCGDTSINQPDNKTNDQFTSFKTLKYLTISKMPFWMRYIERYSSGKSETVYKMGYYQITTPSNNENTPYSKPNNSWPDSPGFGLYQFITPYEIKDSTYSFFWGKYLRQTPQYLTTLTFTLDTTAKKAKNIIYYTESKDGDKSEVDFKISEAPYTIKNKEMVISLSGAMFQSRIYDFGFYESNYKFITSYYTRESDSLLTFEDDTELTIKFALE